IRCRFVPSLSRISRSAGCGNRLGIPGGEGNLLQMNEDRLRRSFFRRLPLALLFLAVAGATALGQKAARTPLPFEPGEELVYQAEFTKGLLRSVDVGELNFTSASEHISRGADDAIVLRLTGDIVSKGLFPKIAGFKLHQHVVSTASPEPFT